MLAPAPCILWEAFADWLEGVGPCCEVCRPVLPLQSSLETGLEEAAPGVALRAPQARLGIST